MTRLAHNLIPASIIWSCIAGASAEVHRFEVKASFTASPDRVATVSDALFEARTMERKRVFDKATFRYPSSCEGESSVDLGTTATVQPLEVTEDGAIVTSIEYHFTGLVDLKDRPLAGCTILLPMANTTAGRAVLNLRPGVPTKVVSNPTLELVIELLE